MNKINMSSIKGFVLGTIILELVLLTAAFLYWATNEQRTMENLNSSLFMTGAIFAGLGTIFHLSAHESTKTEFDRKSYYRGEADYPESFKRSRADMIQSYFHANVFITAGLIAVALCYLMHYLT